MKTLIVLIRIPYDMIDFGYFIAQYYKSERTTGEAAAAGLESPRPVTSRCRCPPGTITTTTNNNDNNNDNNNNDNDNDNDNSSTDSSYNNYVIYYYDYNYSYDNDTRVATARHWSAGANLGLRQAENSVCYL